MWGRQHGHSGCHPQGQMLPTGQGLWHLVEGGEERAPRVEPGSASAPSQARRSRETTVMMSYAGHSQLPSSGDSGNLW
jgi:hypothetical protein